jgi:hypothetical protein
MAGFCMFFALLFWVAFLVTLLYCGDEPRVSTPEQEDP